ncbi:MAG TPA: cytochrome P450 [Thermoleophilaceae bacterium]|jgi:cytochrome P450
MSVSEATPGAPPQSRNGTGPHGESRLPELSLADSSRVIVAGLVPALVRGLFKPRVGASRRLTAIDADRRTVEVLGRIRRRHPGQGARLLGGRMVVLWGADAIREVLEGSATTYASDAGAKRKGMCHFQPDALTISRGEEWRDRREFTESVLATSERVHPSGERFVAVVADEVARLRIGGRIEWAHFERLFDRIALRVIFGDGARDDQELTGLLAKLMEQANRVVGTGEGDSDDYHELHARMEWHLREPEPGSLVARFAEAPHSDRTRVVHQIPHWVFATRDTLAANACRALAAIVADPEVERRVREELDGQDLSDPAAIDGLRYLEGCLGEAMRLWPSTPLIARETTEDTTLAGERIEAGTQVMIVNAFNHRDPDSVADADRLRPERWESGERDYRFNHLSNGTQDCPGGALVYLLGKAALAQLLDRWDLTLEEPRLEPGEPLPHMLDFYSVLFEARRRP